MHKYFNFAKIYEAEQAGEPLSPEEMGTPTTQDKPVETKLADFSALAADHLIEVTLTAEDRENLKAGNSVIKTDAQWKKKTGDQTKDITDINKIIFNTKNETSKNEEDALIFNLDDPNTPEGITARILYDFERPETSEHMEVLNGLAQNGTTVPNVTVNFLRSTEPDTSAGKEEVVPASPEQVESGAVVPKAVSGDLPNESRIMKFDQFVNEAKKKEKWIGEINMKKGALKKEMKDDKLSMADLNKEEAKLKKKDKDKKKPGLQLDAKDAKTRKRVTLAKNLMKASGASKK